MEKMQPVIKRQDGQLKFAVFKFITEDGKARYSIQGQRSYKKKGTEEWVQETINMFPEDLLRLANLATTTYTDIRADMFKDNKNYTKPENTDIPF